MKKLSVIAFVFLCVFMCISSAHAVSYYYKYVGNYFNDFINSPDVDGEYTIADKVEISFWTISGLLPDTVDPNLSTLDDISLLIENWRISDGQVGILGSGSPSGDPFIPLAHVTGGKIDAWDFKSVIGISPYEWYHVHSTHNPGVITIDFGETHSWVDGVGDVKDRGSIQITSGPIGTWEVVPEPATMLLLGVGLIGFAGARRKMK